MGSCYATGRVKFLPPELGHRIVGETNPRDGGNLLQVATECGGTKATDSKSAGSGAAAQPRSRIDLYSV